MIVFNENASYWWHDIIVKIIMFHIAIGKPLGVDFITVLGAMTFGIDQGYIPY